MSDVENICLRWESAFKKGVRFRIEGFLGDVPDQDRRLLLFRELLGLELALLVEDGDNPDPVGYLRRFPEYEEVIKAEFVKLTPNSEVRPKLPERYRMEKILGQGGFGIVYLAHDEQLRRLVAIKVPHSYRVSNPADAAAYLTEARTVANLDHPNIVPVYDFGSTDDCPCFIVSKFIDGTDLATRLKQSRLSIHEAVELVATVAEALHHAHKQGLVHRDIKPGNILLDKSGKPYVADFGLALREQDVGKGPRYAGTPAYMSPEQARGEGHRVDGRSDIFSLGVVFYEMLAGRPPFRGDSQADLMEQIIRVEARPPRQINDSIHKTLECIVLKAIAKKDTNRYTTARDMAEDLRNWQDKKETVSLSSHPVYKSTMSHSVVVLLASMFVAILLSGWAWQVSRAAALAEGNELLNKQVNRATALAEANERLRREARRVSALAEANERLRREASRVSALAEANERLRREASRATALADANERLRMEVKRATALAEAKGLVNELVSARTALVPTIISKLEERFEVVQPLLWAKYERPSNPLEKLRAALALLRKDKSLLRFAKDGLLDAACPEDISVLRQELSKHQNLIRADLWNVANGLLPLSSQNSQSRLRAAYALALYDPNHKDWDQLGETVVDNLVKINSSNLPVLIEGFRPVKNMLRDRLEEYARDLRKEMAPERKQAITILAEYAPELFHKAPSKEHKRHSK